MRRGGSYRCTEIGVVERFESMPERSPEDALKAALAALEHGNPHHWNERGEPDLNHLTEALRRRVTRKEVRQAQREMEG